MEAILATTAPSSVNEVFTGELNASNVVNSNPDIDSDIGIIDSDIGNNNNNNDTDTVGNDQESNSLINDMIDTNNEDNDDDDNPSSSSGMQSSVTSTSTTNPNHRQHKSELFQQILRHKQSWLKDQVQQHHHHCSAAVFAAASNHQNHFENVNKQLTSSTPGSNGSVTVGNNQHQHSGNGSNGISSSDYYMGLALKQWSVYLGNVLLNFIHKECKPSIHHHGHQHNSLPHHEQQHHNNHHHHQIKCSNPQLVQCPAAARNNNILNAIQSNPAMNNSSLPQQQQLQEQNHTSHHDSNNQLLHPHTTKNQINTNDPHPDANQPSLDQSAHNNNDNISNNNNNNTNNVIIGNGCSGDDGENADNDDDDNNINGGGMHHAAAVGIGNGSLQQQHNQIQPQTPTTSSTDIEAANVNNGVVSNGNVLNTAVIAASYCPCCRYHSSCNPTNNATNNINSFVPQSQTSSTLTTSATSCSSLSSNPFVMMSNPSQNTTPSLQQQQQNYYNSYAHFLQHRRYHVSSLLVVTSDINRIYSARNIWPKKSISINDLAECKAPKKGDHFKQLNQR